MVPTVIAMPFDDQIDEVGEGSGVLAHPELHLNPT